MLPIRIHQTHIPTTFGSARYLDPSEAKMWWLDQAIVATMEKPRTYLCPYLGELRVPGDRQSSFLYARPVRQTGSRRREPGPSQGHLLTVAPPRAGKGTGQILPNLLTWEGSCLVLDIKGENYRYSAGYRASADGLKQRVFRFAPFEKPTDVWNPVMSIGAPRQGRRATFEEYEEDANYMSSLLMVPSGSNNDAFWESSARQFLEGLLLFVRTAPLGKAPVADKKDSFSPRADINRRGFPLQERSMGEVRRLLTLEGDEFQRLLVAMGRSIFPVVRQAASTMAQAMKGEGKMGISVLAFARDQTHIWASTRLQKATYKGKPYQKPLPNDFEFSWLRDGQTTLYVIIPPQEMARYRSVLRVLVGMAMRELVSSRDSSSDQPPVLFLLDEFPQLGNMQIMEEALDWAPGYDIRLWFFIQDLSQLQQHYPHRWKAFFSNTGFKSFFGVNDLATAQYVSEYTGTMTVKNMSYGHNLGSQQSESWGTNQSGNYAGVFPFAPTSTTEGTSYTYTEGTSEGVSAQMAFTSRRLITPDEVLRLRYDEMLVFMQGVPPLRVLRPGVHDKYPDKLLLKQHSLIPPPHPVNFK